MKTHSRAWMQALVFGACCTVMAAGCCHTHSAYREIHRAATDGDVASVAADLRTRPDDLNLPNDAGQTPLHLAAVHCRTNVVALLLDKGAKIDATMKGNATPLHLAAQSGCAAAVVMLLSKDADVNARDNEGHTPLWRAEHWHQDARPIEALL